MADIFTENATKRTPRSYGECIASNALSDNLWYWARRLEILGKWALVIVLILGIVLSITAVSDAHELLEELDDRGYSRKELAEYEAKFGIEVQTEVEAFLDTFIPWFGCVLIIYCAYNTLALAVGALASITQHTRISANLAMLNAQNSSAPAVHTAPAAPPVSAASAAPAAPATWSCACGKVHSANYQFCDVCGRKKQG